MLRGERSKFLCPGPQSLLATSPVSNGKASTSARIGKQDARMAQGNGKRAEVTPCQQYCLSATFAPASLKDSTCHSKRAPCFHYPLMFRRQYAVSVLSTPGTCNVASKNGGWTSICTSAGKHRLTTQPPAFKQYGQSTMESSQKPFPLRIAKSPGEKPNTVPLSSQAALSAGPNFQ